jgi:hypothetical protein
MSALLDDIFINSETFLITDFMNLKKATPVFQRCLGWFQWSPSPLAYIYCVISVFSLPLLIANAPAATYISYSHIRLLSPSQLHHFRFNYFIIYFMDNEFKKYIRLQLEIHT